MLSIENTRILLGVLLLAFGRRLFWLFVGAAGFVGANLFANQFLPRQSDETVVVFCLIVGFISAVMAMTLRKIALGAAGFILGGYLLMSALAGTSQEHELALAVGSGGQHLAPTLAFLVGGFAGAILMNVLFVWTLIVLSSWAGAKLICDSLHLSAQTLPVVFLVLMCGGILAQSGVVRRFRQRAAE